MTYIIYVKHAYMRMKLKKWKSENSNKNSEHIRRNSASALSKESTHKKGLVNVLV